MDMGAFLNSPDDDACPTNLACCVFANCRGAFLDAWDDDDVAVDKGAFLDAPDDDACPTNLACCFLAACRGAFLNACDDDDAAMDKGAILDASDDDACPTNLVETTPPFSFEPQEVSFLFIWCSVWCWYFNNRRAIMVVFFDGSERKGNSIAVGSE